MFFRNALAQDGAAIWSIVKNSGVLDLNSSYSYLMMGHYFSDTCMVAEGEQLVGFVNGFIPPKQPDTLFIWQVAVNQAGRGQGIGLRLLQNLLQAQPSGKIKYLEATISPSNSASHALFGAAARSLNAEKLMSPLFPEQWFPPGHEEEELCRIGPFSLS
ncbi:MAG: diaminobutyrate acetyltransferase [Spirochaetaceae bacterium]|nr:MAG: diaminobutyrate acetyltransferase [Spirochaetaceae bacterium]